MHIQPTYSIPFVGLFIKNKSIFFKIINAALVLLAVLFILYALIFWSFTNHALIPLAIVLILEINKRLI